MSRVEIEMGSAKSTGSNESLESESMVVEGETSMKQVTGQGSIPDVAARGSALCRLPPLPFSPRVSFSLHISPGLASLLLRSLSNSLFLLA
jgi:hypothetical protein